MHNVESEPMDQTPDADWNDNWLIGRNAPQSPAIEMIEMRVGHEHEIDRRQMMDVKSGFLQPFDHFKPHRPDRIDQDIDLVRLN